MIFHNVCLCSSNPSNIRCAYPILPRVAYWLKFLVPIFTFQEWSVTMWAWIWFPFVRVLFSWMPATKICVYMSTSWWPPTAWPSKSPVLPSICYSCIGCLYDGNNYYKWINKCLTSNFTLNPSNEILKYTLHFLKICQNKNLLFIWLAIFYSQLWDGFGTL